MTTPATPCYSCMHYRGYMQCDAFPEQIPKAILLAQLDHQEPVPGDHGIRYERGTPTVFAGWKREATT